MKLLLTLLLSYALFFNSLLNKTPVKAKENRIAFPLVQENHAEQMIVGKNAWLAFFNEKDEYCAAKLITVPVTGAKEMDVEWQTKPLWREVNGSVTEFGPEQTSITYKGIDGKYYEVRVHALYNKANFKNNYGYRFEFFVKTVGIAAEKKNSWFGLAGVSESKWYCSGLTVLDNGDISFLMANKVPKGSKQ